MLIKVSSWTLCMKYVNAWFHYYFRSAFCCVSGFGCRSFADRFHPDFLPTAHPYKLARKASWMQKVVNLYEMQNRIYTSAEFHISCSVRQRKLHAFLTRTFRLCLFYKYQSALKMIFVQCFNSNSLSLNIH